MDATRIPLVFYSRGSGAGPLRLPAILVYFAPNKKNFLENGASFFLAPQPVGAAGFRELNHPSPQTRTRCQMRAVTTGQVQIG